jgi:putative sigma-54 modulation protein
MPISYSARQFEITPAIKQQVEQALARMQTIIGNESIDVSVFIAADRKSVKAELSAKYAGHQLKSESSAADGTSALGLALDKLTHQVQKTRSRLVGEKRRARKEHERLERTSKAEVQPEQRPASDVTVGAEGLQTVPVVVHDFPARVKVTETHIVRSEGAVAKKRLSLEEAVKELEFRDRDVLVFRDAKGKLNVLYRNREGRLEVIEIP